MSPLSEATYIVYAIALVGQAVLLWLQVRAFRRYEHTSFAILAIGTLIGLVATSTTVLAVAAPYLLITPTQAHIVFLVLTSIQVPVGLWGVVWLFQSYGQLRSRNQGVA